ncbi:hypothetical protein Poli38472_012699 [Pythium oligandrum]|uniref:RBR-type E3 ubiquitin transferase n=1 Tax=Pythium oligandrum TaxID=41045 RepID=A0A8K1CFB5_PYTOL|nr:hypothetical protein Poli38472_012699 [Pythium oligandrum]|eukprot:TMW61508.1 hypothetical protein Poli38472_012699 [Pythium oligandrum]
MSTPSASRTAEQSRPTPPPPVPSYSRSLSVNSDDEYNYSDVEDDDYAEDEEEVVYTDEEDEDAASDDHHAVEGKLSGTARLSPMGAHSGSAHKKKRINPGLGQDKSNADYRVIDEKELFQEQRRLVNDVAQVLEITPSVTAILLGRFGWNKEKLYEGYWADALKARQDAGVEFADQPAPTFTEGQEIDCRICYDTYGPNEVFGMGCGHVYCLHCWKSYLSLKITEGPTCVHTTCPADGCKEVVSDAIFEKFLTPEEFSRYSRFVLRSYVDINKGVSWCPSPGCNNAISSAGGLSSVRCTCGCLFCLRCGEEAHSPVNCEQLQLWMEKCRNESETANWILANTKKCPKCAVRIEKNQGCNHMTCRKCAHEFCWICMEAWDKHGSGTGGYYKCNRYEAQAALQDSDAARAKAELDRYLHYYQRYANHSEAAKFAQRMREGTEARMIELQASNGDSSWIDVQFLNAATELLIECRRVLKYTYVFGYYLPPGKEKNLFEYLQENLEKNTEHLTGLSETPLDKVDRAEVVNYTRVTENFLRNLLTGVEDGLTSGGAMLQSS